MQRFNFQRCSDHPSRLTKSPIPGLTLVKPSLSHLIKSDPMPPWHEPVKLVFHGSRHSGTIHCSDFWSPRMRKDIVNTYFPSQVQSKVAKWIKMKTHRKDGDASERDSLPSINSSKPQIRRNNSEDFAVKEKLWKLQ